MFENLKAYYAAQPPTFFGLPRWAWSLIGPAFWVLALFVASVDCVAGYAAGLLLLAAFASAAAILPWKAVPYCDGREDPEQSPCVKHLGHEGDHEDEAGETWPRLNKVEPSKGGTQ